MLSQHFDYITPSESEARETTLGGKQVYITLQDEVSATLDMPVEYWMATLADFHKNGEKILRKNNVEISSNPIHRTFKEYCERWAFKHPTPADFFRTMEDASGVDLDWFWRGWFYSIENVDIALDSINWYKVDLKNKPKKVERNFPQTSKKPFDDISKVRNKKLGVKFKVEEDKKNRWQNNGCSA